MASVLTNRRAVQRCAERGNYRSRDPCPGVRPGKECPGFVRAVEEAEGFSFRHYLSGNRVLYHCSQLLACGVSYGICRASIPILIFTAVSLTQLSRAQAPPRPVSVNRVSSPSMDKPLNTLWLGSSAFQVFMRKFYEKVS